MSDRDAGNEGTQLSNETPADTPAWQPQDTPFDTPTLEEIERDYGPETKEQRDG